MLSWQAVPFHHALHGFGKQSVFQLNRRVLLGGGLHSLGKEGEFLRELLQQLGSVPGRQVPRQVKGVGALPQLPQHPKAFRFCPTGIGCQQQGLPCAGLGGELPFYIPKLLLFPLELPFQGLCLLGRRQLPGSSGG